MASFYKERMDVDSHDASKVIHVDGPRQKFVKDYRSSNVNMVTHALMHRFCDTEFCDANPFVEMAKVAAVSCIHHCIPAICRANVKAGQNAASTYRKDDGSQRCCHDAG